MDSFVYIVRMIISLISRGMQRSSNCVCHRVSILPVLLLLENTMGSIFICGYCCLSRICFENQMSSLPCVLTLSSTVMNFQPTSFHLSHNLTLHLIDFQDIKKLIFLCELGFIVRRFLDILLSLFVIVYILCVLRQSLILYFGLTLRLFAGFEVVHAHHIHLEYRI